MNIAEILRQQVAARSLQPAIIDGRSRQTLSFLALDAAVGRAARLLHQTGLQAGDGVLIFQPMSAQLYVALLALFRLGMVAIFVDPSAGRSHLDRCCGLFPPKALIASDRAHGLRLRSSALRQIPHKFVIGLPVPGAMRWSQADYLIPWHKSVDCEIDTPALLTFTSGSTGTPKAVLRTHGFLMAQHQALARSLTLTAGEIDLATLPIFVLANLASGVTSLIPNVDLRFPGQINPARVLSHLQQFQPTSTAASPALLNRLADYCEHRQVSLSPLKRLFSGGAPVFPILLTRLQHLAPQSEVSAVYGSTEAEPIAHIRHRQIQPDDVTAMQNGGGLLVGIPVSELQLRILPHQWGQAIGPYDSKEFEAIALSSGAIGEIVVSGAHVLSSYLHGQGNTETKFQVDGCPWHRTGDAGYVDDQGRLWLMGRCSARIQDQYGELYPFAVETAASYYPGIRRTALVSHRGQRILAIEWASGAAKDGLATLKDSLMWAQIQDYRVYARLPVDQRHNAKIDYPALYRLLDS